ncbi:hypothetical protein L596_030715 [Steinernema carpocapsae]|uniref:Chondroitin proteoglycan 4 domain-containing protein n=1 Tax=Steinernema carpocapsae TaxID=34508 RepID=A0A4U5LNJ6_STECR|nr:hypothetical protein L596_030715 [Steinernema carpocapsae]
MGVFGVVFLAVLVQFSVALPMFQAKLDSAVDGNPCVKQCMAKIVDSKLELNIAKTVDYGFYLQHLDQICEIVSESKACIDQCGINPNPFAMKHMTVMCTPEAMRTAMVFLPCMKEKGTEVMNECKKTCGPIDEINTELGELTKTLKDSQGSDKVALKQALLMTNQGCSITKCIARCSREGFNSKCEEVGGVDAGEFVKAFIESALQATRADLEEMNLVQVMAANTPPECAYNYIPDVMFNVTDDKKLVKELEQHLPELPPQIRIQQNHQAATQLLALQSEVLNRELTLLAKKDKLLDKEELKLDLEIAAIKKNSVAFA